MANKNPPHPGDYVWAAIVQPKGLTVKAAAEILGVSHISLSSLLNRRADLSPLMAFRLEKVFNVEMETLLYMQATWDAAETRKSAKDLPIRQYSPKNVVLERCGKRGRPTMRVIAPRQRNASPETDTECLPTACEIIPAPESSVST
jgi:addiction module HigA family antidote